MRVLTEELARRIPNFGIVPGTEAKRRAGGVAALEDAQLHWSGASTYPNVSAA